MKIATVITSFFDINEGVSRTSGDTFLCDDARGEHLRRLNLVRVQNAPEPEKPKRTRKKTK